MGSSQLIVRGALAAVLLAGTVAVVGCSRPTPSPGQATAAPQGQPEPGYPGGGGGVEQPEGPKPGEPGYPPPNPLSPPVDDPYPGMTATAAAGGAGAAPAEATGTPTAPATP